LAAVPDELDEQAGTLAVVSCGECGRSPRTGETWRIYFADIGEAVTYCPECAAREFGEPAGQP
jgi:NAD-dependent SIR2 family protein deacetylase